MTEPTQEEVISIVSSIFGVRAIEQRLDSLSFKIENEHFKSKFVQLTHILEKRELVCLLQEKDGSLYVIIRRIPTRKIKWWQRSSWTPRILFVIVVCFVMIDGFYRTVGTNMIVDIGDPLEIAGIYTLSLLGILGVHESGHLVAARFHKLKTTWPFFIPGIPIYGIPTFGACIQSKGLTINREILYDVAIAGPIAGLIITVLVTIYGAYTAPVLDTDIAEDLFANSQLIQWDRGEPILMTAILAMFGKGGEINEVLMTPVLFAAWLGFLITFLNLLPAWQLDGGHMARTLLGKKWHQYATYASMGVLVLLGYWFMAMLILVLMSRSPGAQPLDDVSPLSKNRKLTYILIMALAILCAPISQTPLS